MGAVSRLRLAHFRSYRAADLTLDGRPVAVFGPNGAGKTNLVEAVSLLSPGRGLRGAPSEEMARRPEAIGWKVAAETGGHAVATWSEGAGRRVEIDGKAATQTALGEILRVLWVTPAMDRLWLDAPAERRRYLDRVTLSLLPGHAGEVMAYERALKERNRLIREGVRDAGWFAALEGRMAGFGARVIANRAAAVGRLRAVPAGAGFPRAELEVVPEGGPRDEGGMAAALGEGRARDQAAGRTLTGPHRDELGAVYAEKGMAARLCSTGEQKALILSLALANARAVADAFGAAPVLLLDEVAAHLDAGRREALYAAVLGLGAQAWMTGTGPEVFDGLGEWAQRIRVSEGAGGSVAQCDRD